MKHNTRSTKACSNSRAMRGLTCRTFGRLIHKPSGTPVAGAHVIETRLVMPHHGSADMISAIAPLPDPEPNVFAFKAPMMMEGDWLLTIAAKIPGQSELVTGTLVFRVNR
jgi:YtkA-like